MNFKACVSKSNKFFKKPQLMLIFVLAFLALSKECRAEEVFLICEGNSSSSIVDKDEESRSKILRNQPDLDRADKQTYILRNQKLLHSSSQKEVRGCKVDKYNINCSQENHNDGMANNSSLFYKLEINRLNGAIHSNLTVQVKGGQINGIKSIQIQSMSFDGICKTTNKLAF